MLDPVEERATAARWHLVGAAVVAVLLIGHIWMFWGQINDDAFITFRYSLNLAEGRGPYFNPGEHVEGYTNFFLMIVIAGVIAVGGADTALPAAKMFNALGAALACGCAALLVLRWLRDSDTLRPVLPLLAWSTAALVAANAGFILNTTTGLETASFAGLLILGLLLVQLANDSEQWRGAGVAFALAALSRPEGALAFAASWIGRVVGLEWRSRGGRRRLIWDGILVTAVVGAHFAFRFVMYDGELLPNTYFAKRGGFQWGVTAVDYLLGYLVINLAIIIPLLGMFAALLPKPLDRTQLFPALAVVLVGLAGSLSTGSGWMPGYRLLQPYSPIWAALAVAGIAAVALWIQRLHANPRSAQRGACVSALLLLIFTAWWQGPQRDTWLRYALVRAAGYRNGHMQVAKYLRARTAPGDVVALMDIGIISYRLPDRVVLDITGLTDRFVAKSPGGFLAKEFDPKYVFDHEPAAIVCAATGPGIMLTPAVYADLHPWTEIEARLLKTRAFADNYFTRQKVPEPPAMNASRQEQLEYLAIALGAGAVFQHDYPDQLYLLAVYERNLTPPRNHQGAP